MQIFAGIHGNSVSSGLPVVIDAAGKLGTAAFMITSADIVDDMVASVDILDGTLASVDLGSDAWTLNLTSTSSFTVKNSTGAIDRFSVDEATGNISRNGALFVHTTGQSRHPGYCRAVPGRGVPDAPQGR